MPDLPFSEPCGMSPRDEPRRAGRNREPKLPEGGGLSTFQAQSILRGLGHINLIAMDLVEVAPVYDQADITSLAGATLALDYLCLRALELPDKKHL